MCEIFLFIQEHVSGALQDLAQVSPVQFYITINNSKTKILLLSRQSHLGANQFELLFPHFLHSDAKQSHKREFETQKKGVEGSTAIRKTMQAPAKSMT